MISQAYFSLPWLTNVVTHHEQYSKTSIVVAFVVIVVASLLRLQAEAGEDIVSSLSSQ